VTLDDLRFTAVLRFPLHYREAVLRLLKLLCLYSLLSLGGAVLLLLAKSFIAWIAVPAVATLVVSLLCGSAGAVIFYEWLTILVETPHRTRLSRFPESKPRIRLARWPTLLSGAILSFVLFWLARSRVPIDNPGILDIINISLGGKSVFLAYLAIQVGLGGFLESGERLRNIVLRLLQLLHIVQVERPEEQRPDA
jgi:amino acid transporter